MLSSLLGRLFPCFIEGRCNCLVPVVAVWILSSSLCARFVNLGVAPCLLRPEPRRVLPRLCASALARAHLDAVRNSMRSCCAILLADAEAAAASYVASSLLRLGLPALLSECGSLLPSLLPEYAGPRLSSCTRSLIPMYRLRAFFKKGQLETTPSQASSCSSTSSVLR